MILRLFCVIDYLRLTLVYFRLFNTIFFIYILASSFNQSYESLINLVPYLVILVYPTLFFFLYSLFNKNLRLEWFNLLISYLFNKVFILLSNIVIFTVMLVNIGNANWSSSISEMKEVIVVN